MILVLGGTTEGRKAVAVLEQGDGNYFYSTRGNLQKVDCRRGTHIWGEMSVEKMAQFCRQNGIRLIVDAAHPFATNLHATVHAVSQRLGVPVIRFERTYPHLPNDAVMCNDFDDACRRMKAAGVQKLLALTGVQTIGKLRDFWVEHATIFRILDRKESRDKVIEEGFPESQIVLYDSHNTGALIEETGADAIITKESGESGGTTEKLDAAVKAGIKIFVVKRPQLPQEFITVTGEHGLRRMIEKHCRGFFKLRSGFTTGSCATAAAKAALQALLTGDHDREVTFALPDGETMKMPIARVTMNGETATGVVVKDAGDDPDVTDGMEVHVSVRLTDSGNIKFWGGKGVGTVTLPGTGLPIGEPAINPVPRRMIAHELRSMYAGGVDVTIDVPNGEEIASKTFNSRIGIVGGISIIGTSGIVMPFSHEAFVEAIGKQMEVACAIGAERIVINSGARSERIVKETYPHLPPQAFIHYGNAIGETVKLAAKAKVRNLTIGIMLGKAVKLAEGHMDTHSKNVTLNRSFLCNVASRCGCSSKAVKTISSLNMARELWGALEKNDADKLFNQIAAMCRSHCSTLLPEGSVEVLLISDAGEVAYVSK